MPNLLTHAYFSIDVNNKIKDSVKDIETLKVFSYGPDPFYASKKEIGKIMHRKNIDEFFKNLIVYIKSNNLQDNDSLKACLYGLITHYALDSTIHPFVFYKSGVYLKHDRNTYKYLDKHRITELYIDKYMASKKDIIIEKEKLYKYLFVKTNNDHIIQNCLDETLYSTYKINDGYKQYIKGIKRLKYLYKYIRYDRLGLKYNIYRVIDIFRPNKEKLSNMSYHKLKYVDLNLEHKKWYHPCTNEVSIKSIEDLYEEALEYATSLIDKTNDILNGDDISLVEFNRSLITGLDYREINKLKYFEE